MDKKIKFSNQSTRVKVIYASVIGVLCLTAAVVGIVSATSKKNDIPIDDPLANLPSDGVIGDETLNGGEENKEDEKDENKEEENKKPEKLSFVSPVVGEVTKHHSIDTPVFSTTLNEWRVHTGVDISVNEGAEVYASADGTVSRVYSDPFLGKTVEVTHEGGISTVYSNLDTAGINVKEGDTVKSGDLIGVVGDTSLSELADEAHLHFAIKVNGVSVNPLDYISEDSKKVSLGITDV